MATMAEPRKLRGHKATATCCIASRDRPGLVLTSGEDGCVCWFDLRCKDVQFIIDVGTEPVSSLCFKTGNESILYASSGNQIKSFDIHTLSGGGASLKPLESYNYNKDEVNHVVCNGRSSFLASADDSGDVKIIDIGQKRLYKTLRSGHTSFVPWRPWEVITGGLDSKLILWDFSKGRTQKIIDFGSDTQTSNSGQCLNPAFVHSIAIPEIDMVDKLGKICAVARGDGIVDLINVESELSQKGKSSKGKSSGAMKRVCLDYAVGGHKAAVSCVAFAMFEEKGRFLVSGGNDKTVKVWDCVRCLDPDDNSNNNNIHLDINISKKVNWLCTNDSNSENLIVCDTTRVVKVYSVS